MQRLHPTPLLLHLRPTKRILPSLTHLHPSTTATTASLSTRRYSSGSPTKTTTPADHFIKTGEKPADPADQVSRSYEYSQSGGDDMVAQQSGASFDGSQAPDIAAQKSRAGKGNAVNPLELSPATGELSRTLEEVVTSKSEERREGAVSGHYSGRKTKTVVRKEGVDFR